MSSNISLDDVSSVDSLAIPKRQKVFEKTILPAGDVLPIWANVDLDHKLPVPPSPRDSYTLYTHKVGEPRYINNQKYDFDLTNPQGREAPGSYNSLTDPNLRNYFNSPRTRQHLVNSGLITDRGEIKCSIRDFNEYREFVRYRSVTELSLQRKKEQRVKDESVDRLFMEWPRVHKKNMRRRGKLRMTQSEPLHKEDYRLDGLEMYRENMALALRKREEMSKKRDEEKHSRRGERSRKSCNSLFSPTERKSSDFRSPRAYSPDKTPRIFSPDKTPRISVSPEKSPRHSTDKFLDKTPRYSPEKDSMTPSIFSPRGTTLVEDMRRKEVELNKRLDEQRKQRIEDHKRKIEENWRERQYRQEVLLQHEAEVESKIRDERHAHILERERTLVKQRQKQEDKLRKIKQEMARGNQKAISRMEKSARHSFGESTPDKAKNGDDKLENHHGDKSPVE